jgi:hypothetical protein
MSVYNQEANDIAETFKNISEAVKTSKEDVRRLNNLINSILGNCEGLHKETVDTFVMYLYEELYIVRDDLDDWKEKQNSFLDDNYSFLDEYLEK